MAGNSEAQIIIVQQAANVTAYSRVNYTMPAAMVWAHAIQEHYLKVICGVGLPGNLAAILTIATVKPFSAATFLVALLAASDSVALLMKLVINQLSYSLDPFTDGYCRSHGLVNVLSSYANWVLVLMALERLVAVVFPVLRNRYLSKRRLYVVCLLVLFLLLTVHLPVMGGAVAVSRFECWVREGVRQYKNHAWVWLNSLLYALLPIVLLMAITIALGLALHRARRQRRHLQGGMTTTAAARVALRSERAITAMMLSAAVLFMLLVLPQCLFFILVYHSQVLAHVRYTPGEQLTRQVTTLLADSTHALNFYLYFVSVRRFRHRFLALLFCRAGHRFRSYASMSTGRGSASASGRDRTGWQNGGSGCHRHRDNSRTTQCTELSALGPDNVDLSQHLAASDRVLTTASASPAVVAATPADATSTPADATTTLADVLKWDVMTITTPADVANIPTYVITATADCSTCDDIMTTTPADRYTTDADVTFTPLDVSNPPADAATCDEVMSTGTPADVLIIPTAVDLAVCDNATKTSM